MKNIDVNKPLFKLEIDNKIIGKLKKLNIIKINNLWLKNRKELKLLGLDDSEINIIRIKIQLWGLDLDKKMYI